MILGMVIGFAIGMFFIQALTNVSNLLVIRVENKKRMRHKEVLRRILMLEDQLGIGISLFVQEWVDTLKIKAKPKYLQVLAEEQNGSVEVRCHVCDKFFEPIVKYPRFYSFYKDDRILMQLFCPEHLPKTLLKRKINA